MTPKTFSELADIESDMREQWIETNEDYIITRYVDSLEGEFPDKIYDGVLDDDYEEAERQWFETITIDDVPDEFVESIYVESMSEE